MHTNTRIKCSVVLALACVAPALGQLGDHPAQLQLRNRYSEDRFAFSLAPRARTFGWREEPLELAGSALFVAAALFTLACCWIAVYAPTVAAPPHRKTISSRLWIFPVLGGYVYVARKSPTRAHACQPPG